MGPKNFQFKKFSQQRFFHSGPKNFLDSKIFFRPHNFFRPKHFINPKKISTTKFSFLQLFQFESALTELGTTQSQLVLFFYVSSNRNSDSKVALAAQSIIKFTQGSLFMVKNIFVKKSFGQKLFGQNKFLVKDIFGKKICCCKNLILEYKLQLK